MSEWRETALGDVATVSWGDTTKTKAAYAADGVVAYSASGPDGFLPHADRRGDGVVISAIGAQCGKTWFAQGEWSCIKNTMWFQAGPGANTRFLYYATCDPGKWPKRGAAQPFIGLGDAKRLRLLLPPLELQRQIASVLGALDDLIENNQRRVELLEEIARAVYREWFVRLRYPGHEDVPLVDSAQGPIPEGWQRLPFADLADFVNGYAFKPSHWGSVGRPIIKIKELKGGVRTDTPRCAEEEIDHKYWIEPGDLLFSWSADLGVYRWFGEPGLLNQHLFVVTPRSGLSTSFMQHALDGAMTQFWDRAQGTTMRHIKRSALREVPTLVPPVRLVNSFTTAVEPLAQEMLTLRQASRNLTELRDLLLPKLVTGKVDVSHLALDGLTEAAVA